jgi:hypothetical protein
VSKTKFKNIGQRNNFLNGILFDKTRANTDLLNEFRMKLDSESTNDDEKTPVVSTHYE